MDLARDRVSAACLKSQYKDDRHDWNIMCEDGFTALSCMANRPKYALRQCSACKLTVLMREFSHVAYNEAPKRSDEIIFAFFASTPDA